MAYIGDMSGFITAVDITNGEVAWSIKLGGDITSSPAVIDDTVYIRNGEDILFALDAVTGEERWRFVTGGDGGYTLDTAPAVADGVVYMTTIDSDGDDSLFSLDAATGKERWHFAPDVPGLFTPVVVDGTVFAAGSGGLYAVDADTGDQRWKSPIGEGFSAPAVADGTVVVHTRSNLVAVDAATGDEQWRYNSGGSWSAPVVVDGMVYVGSSGMGRSGLHVVALDSGDIVWHVQSIGSVNSSPVVAGGMVYITSSEGLFAFGSSDNAVAAGVDPVVSMMVGQLVFAVGVEESGAPIEPGMNLPSGVTGIEVLFDFAGIPEGATYRIDWFLNGELLLEGATTPWTIGAMGNANDGISSDKGALPDGTCEAVVSFNDQELRRGTVTVGGG